MKYILYARKSTEEDDRQVLSIEAQLIELQEYAAKEKLEIVASFQEAKTAKEPGRIKFAEQILCGQFARECEKRFAAENQEWCLAWLGSGRLLK
ncbi:MAG: Recombinase [Candidatus Nomurabacteria bacterium GW2011_GWA1_37_20]|uniref:Recombinase n=1 Tax=Candidatus Nomurabacteria bacterium GW2011_GWA1_37_20 TaxID=1618729 RepID=A0A0G0GGY9_9BACT|nr:MAG: Recombinase [Candidatus Nomurabacteria bacterium GW2011_GWA1_37_20]